MTNATYRVSGMTCQGCVNSLSKAIAHAGIEGPCNISLESGTVEVRTEHETEVLKRAVADAGFVFEGQA